MELGREAAFSLSFERRESSTLFEKLDKLLMEFCMIFCVGARMIRNTYITVTSSHAYEIRDTYLGLRRIVIKLIRGINLRCCFGYRSASNVLDS